MAATQGTQETQGTQGTPTEKLCFIIRKKNEKIQSKNLQIKEKEDIIQCLYKVNTEKGWRISKLEHELNCKNDLIDKIKQKLAAEADHTSILAMIDETKPSPASVISSISDVARRSHFTLTRESLHKGLKNLHTDLNLGGGSEKVRDASKPTS